MVVFVAARVAVVFAVLLAVLLLRRAEGGRVYQ